MKFQLFNNILDEFVLWAEKKMERCGTRQGSALDLRTFETMQSEFDPELIGYHLFVEYFTSDTNHLVQIYDRDSPMRQVFRFGTVLTRTRPAKAGNGKASTGKENKIVMIKDKVLRDSMLDPSTMNFLSDDLQNRFLKESIQASSQLEKEI